MTLYQQIMQDIRECVESGKYPPGSKLPTEEELTQIYDVSRVTIRRSIAELVAKGILETRHGIGTFVRSPLVRILKTRFSVSFSDICVEEGLTPRAQLIDMTIINADSQLAEGLSVEEGALLLRIRRLLSADTVPILDETSYLRFSQFMGLAAEHLENISFFDTIELISGRRPTITVNSTIQSVAATEEHAKLLSVATNAPLLKYNALYADADEIPLCLTQAFYVGERCIFEI